MGESCERPEPTLVVNPSTAGPGTQVSVTGDYWPCVRVRVSPSWPGGAVQSLNVDQGSFDASVPVGDQVESGSYSIQASCGENSAARPVKIVSTAKPTTTTTKPKPTTTRPTAEIITETGTPETTDAQPSIVARSDDGPRGNNLIGSALAVVALLLAVGVATLVARRRRRVPDGTRAEHRDPGPPRVRVRVVAETSPSIRVRELTRPTGPAVRVRVRVGEPRIRVREIPR
ncbi:hypothetical protein GCM10027089_46850 [Nocardia thraciensis]